MSQVREAWYTPSPLVEILQDPYLSKQLTTPRRASRRPSTSTLERSQSRSRKDDRSDAPSVLNIVLAEEERQVNHLKSLLRSAGDRLETEIRRADQVESRAQFAESRTMELQIRLSTAETARHQSELDAARAKEEVRRHQMQLEMSERELQRVRSSVTNLTRQKEDAEREANKAREQSRDYLQKIREYEAREDGREEGRRIGQRKGYNAGWEECWPVAHAEGHGIGYEKGRSEGYAEGHAKGHKAGRGAGHEATRKRAKTEGYNEGVERGRKVERERALDAFDKLLADEVDEDSVPRDRTELWVRESLKNTPEPKQLLHPIPSRSHLISPNQLLGPHSRSSSSSSSSTSSASLVVS